MRRAEGSQPGHWNISLEIVLGLAHRDERQLSEKGTRIELGDDSAVDLRAPLLAHNHARAVHDEVHLARDCAFQKQSLVGQQDVRPATVERDERQLLGAFDGLMF